MIESAVAPVPEVRASHPNSGHQAGSVSESPAQTTKLGDNDIQIDPEFATLITPLTPEEEEQLEANLLADRVCHDPLTVWKGHGLLLDGHHRHKHCRRHGIPFRVVEIDLADRDAAMQWIIDHQLGRRSVTPYVASFLRGRLYQSLKKDHGGARQAGASSQTETLKTSEIVAAKTGVSPATVHRDDKFATAVDTLAETCGPAARQAVLSGSTKLNREQVCKIAAMDPAEQRAALEDAPQPDQKSKKKSNKKLTITVPRSAVAFASVILTIVGEKRARRVHEELGRRLQARPEEPDEEAD